MASIEVVYEKGIFRPLEPVELPEGAVGEVIIAPSSAPADARDQATTANDNEAESAGQRAYRLLMEIAALSHTAPDERTDVGVHHDSILYPKHGKMP